jgi:hypothetical protein
MQYLSRLVAENGERYYLLSKCDEREVHDMQLLLTDGCDVWEKTLSKEDLKKLSKEASMEFRPYVEETLKALTKYRRLYLSQILIEGLVVGSVSLYKQILTFTTPYILVIAVVRSSTGAPVDSLGYKLLL